MRGRDESADPRTRRPLTYRHTAVVAAAVGVLASAVGIPFVLTGRTTTPARAAAQPTGADSAVLYRAEQLLIGDWLPSGSAKFIRVQDPATGRTLARVADGTAEDREERESLLGGFAGGQAS